MREEFVSPLGVLHVPHSSTTIPDDLRPALHLSDQALREEILVMTDWHTDDLFTLPSSEAVTVRYSASRLIVDPERFPDDDLEPMASRGMGAIYTKTSSGAPLRDAPSPAEREALLERFYRPHHVALASAVRAALARHGHCVVVDCHSFPSTPLPYEIHQSATRPDICIGTDPFHTPDWLSRMGTQLFAAAGFSVELNHPFSGSLVPGEFYGSESSVRSLMVEVNRTLYLDESTGEKLAEFPEVASLVQTAVQQLLNEYQSRSPSETS